MARGAPPVVVDPVAPPAAPVPAVLAPEAPALAADDAPLRADEAADSRLETTEPMPEELGLRALDDGITMWRLGLTIDAGIVLVIKLPAELVKVVTAPPAPTVLDGAVLEPVTVTVAVADPDPPVLAPDPLAPPVPPATAETSVV